VDGQDCGASFQALTCTDDPNGIKLSWPLIPNVQKFDLQLGVPQERARIAGHIVGGTTSSVVVRHVKPSQTYWFQLFAQMVSNTTTAEWNPVALSSPITCTAPLFNVSGANLMQQSPEYFSNQMIRLHSPPGDGLAERNAANARGEEWLLGTPWKLGTCELTLYNVQIRKDNLPGQMTPQGQGHGHYANYMSCDNYGGGYACRKMDFGDCIILGINSNCGTARNNTYSLDHVGMGLVARTHGEGRWYSLPKAGEGSTWTMDTHYRTAKCHRGMKAQDIKNALHTNMGRHLAPWWTDIPAFDGFDTGSALEKGIGNALSSQASKAIIV